MDCFLPLASLSWNLLAQSAAAEVTATDSGGLSSGQWMILVALVAVIVIPTLLGNVIAKMFRMPNYATRIGVILFALLASGLVLSVGKLKRGIDLAGGTILVYQIDPNRSIQTGTDEGDDLMERVTSAKLIPSLTKRINPAGTQEIVLRPYGEDQIEIIVPAKDQLEVETIKSKIAQAGILRFAIVANARDHSRLIELARLQADGSAQGTRLSKTVFDDDGKTPVGFWALVDREDSTNAEGVRPLRVDISRSVVRNPADGKFLEIPFTVGGPEGVAKWMTSQSIENIQVLMSVDPQLDVTGEDLAFAATGYDEQGGPCVRFKLTDSGSGRFEALTTNNAPDGQHLRFLGIVLDDALLSAPSIRSPISGDGQITGNFSKPEVDQLVSILQAGQLPAALTSVPIAENQIDPTLGADTIRKGLLATGSSLIAVLVFMAIYYRFVGLVACFALVLNLVMTLAVMILINQPLTLPGLAGLVLTVGMSVDANILIFERIREELAKGAAARMAIRNGYARATTTIVDSNLTTLITAIVLYAIGTDQIRGFAVTLILGIIFSMFTAIYVSRTLLDIAERRGFLSLSMSNAMASLRDGMTQGKGFRFMNKRRLAAFLSGSLVAAGLVAIAARGSSIFDIDFSGGSSVTFRLEEPSTTETVRNVVGKILDQEGAKIDHTVNNVTVDNTPDGTVYKIDTSIEDVEELKQRIGDGIEADGTIKLISYDVEIAPAGEPKSSQRNRSSNGLKLVSAIAQDDVPADGDNVADDEPSVTAAAGTSPAVKAVDSAIPAVAGPEVMSRANLKLEIQGQMSEKSGISGKTLIEDLVKAAAEVGIAIDPLGIDLKPIGTDSDQWSTESQLRFSEWIVGLPMEFGPADEILGRLKESLGNVPVWYSSSKVGSRVAGDMVGRAISALIASFIAIIAYMWFRFNHVFYGLAAVAALVHDVLITIGAIAVSYWLADALGFMLVDQFKISLTVVASLLTLIGYSLNDTIVVFDRIRETKGKSLRLTDDIIDTSINSTLSRTLLTSLTTFLVVTVLYFFGGEGIHGFAFALVIGIIVGTYSSIFIASPILLWLAEKYQPAARVA